MIDPEFYLVRLTAQSKGADPKLPAGGKPELTAQDIQTLCSWIPDLFAYWSVTAKFCQSDISEKNLVEFVQRLSWKAWYDNPANRKAPLEPALNDKLAEAAVLLFLNPRDQNGNLRKDAWIAAYIGKHRNTFQQKYRPHFMRLAAKLFEGEAVGLRCIRRALRKEAA